MQHTKRRAYSPEQNRKNKLSSYYDLTLADYDAMFAAQDGRCGICRKPETHVLPNGNLRALSVDHSHTTGRIRALLCGSCNRALGMLRDDPLFVARATAYLLEHSK
jgi:hypothetical protein